MLGGAERRGQPSGQRLLLMAWAGAVHAGARSTIMHHSGCTPRQPTPFEMCFMRQTISRSPRRRSDLARCQANRWPRGPLHLISLQQSVLPVCRPGIPMSCPLPRIGDSRTVRQVVDAHAAHGTRYRPLELGSSWNTLGKLVRQQSEKHVLRGAPAMCCSPSPSTPSRRCPNSTPARW